MPPVTIALHHQLHSTHNRRDSAPQNPANASGCSVPPPPPPPWRSSVYFPGEHLDLSRTDEAETDGPTQRHRHVPTYQHAGCRH